MSHKRRQFMCVCYDYECVICTHRLIHFFSFNKFFDRISIRMLMSCMNAQTQPYSSFIEKYWLRERNIWTEYERTNKIGMKTQNRCSRWRVTKKKWRKLSLLRIGSTYCCVRLYAGICDGLCERSLLWFTKNPLTRQCGEDEKKIEKSTTTANTKNGS